MNYTGEAETLCTSIAIGNFSMDIDTYICIDTTFILQY